VHSQSYSRLNPNHIGPGIAGEEVFDIDGDNHVVSEEAGPPAHPHGPVTGNKRIRAQFARKRTHNEQLIVAPCGVIIARTTFFGSEAVSSVAVCTLVYRI
jgi:hypothetical protein